jgi:WD40 repeat protein
MQRPIRVFVSSPSDVPAERVAVERVTTRISAQFEGVRFSVSRWESGHYYSAHTGFQEQIEEIGKFDLVIGILWSRLGTPLPKTFGKGMPKPREGAAYPSGTAFEILEAIELRRKRTVPPPAILVYRKVAPTPSARADDDAAQEKLLMQRKAVNEFFRDFFANEVEGFKAAFQVFENLDGFEHQLESDLIAWLRTTSRLGRQRLWRVEDPELGCPFVGLNAFDARYREVFFGRRADTERARERLEAGNGFLLIDGPSGTGKSSLARAGLLPRMKDLDPDLRIATTVPDYTDPLAGLTQALFRTGALPELAKGDYPDAPALAGHFRNGGDLSPVIRALDRAAEAVKSAERRDTEVKFGLVLLVDQFETLFASRVPPELRATYARVLEGLVASGRVKVIVTMRANAREAALEVPALGRLINGQQGLSLEPPGVDALAEIIRGPAEAAALAFERNPEGVGLDELLMNEVKNDPAALPLLQFTLQKLYESAAQRVREAGARLGDVPDGAPVLTLTHADYRALGGLSGAIGHQAEAAMRPLRESVRNRLAPLVRALTEEAKGAIVLTRAPFALAVPDVETQELAAALVEARILVQGTERDAESDETVTTLRFSHERILTAWDRAREAARAAAKYLRIRTDLIRDETRWRAAGRKPELLLPAGVRLAEAEDTMREFGTELGRQNQGLPDYVRASGRRARQRQRLVQVAAMGFAVVAAAAGWFAYQASLSAAEADRQRVIAVTNAEEADLQRRAAEKNAEEAGIQRGVAVKNAEEAENQRLAAVSNESEAFAAAAEALVLNHQPLQAVKLALASWPRDASDPRPRLEKAINVISTALSKERLPARIMRHQGAVGGFLLMPDGRILSWSSDGTLKLWDAKTGAQTGPDMRHEFVLDALVMPDGRILSWSGDSKSSPGSLKLWDAETGAQIGPDMRHEDYIKDALVMPDGRVLSWSWDGILRLWDAQTGKETVQTMRHAFLEDALIMPDGRILSWSWYGESSPGSLKLWDAETGAQVGPDMRHDGSVLGALVMPDGHILSWSSDGTLKLWDAKTGLQTGPDMRYDGSVLGALVMPDGRILSWSGDLIESSHGSLKLWDAETGAQVGPDMRHDKPVAGALVMSDGRILSWSGDLKSSPGSVKLWDAKTGLQTGPDMRHDGSVLGTLVMPDGRILSWSTDGTLKLWDAKTGLQIGRDMRHTGSVRRATVVPGDRILSWSLDGSLKLWDAQTGAQIGPNMHHDLEVSGAAQMRDGRILSFSPDGTLRLWETQPGTEIGHDLRHDDGPVNGALVMPDGRILSWSGDILSSHNGSLKLWDARNGKQVGPDMHPEDGPVRGALMMPDGRILSWSNGSLKLWDAQTGAQTGRDMRHRWEIYGAHVMPDGRILSWSIGTLKLWDAKTSLQIGQDMRHNRAVWGALVMPDGRVLSWSGDGTLKFWDSRTGAQIGLDLRHGGGPVQGALVMPDSHILSWSNHDGTLKLWNGQTNTQIGPDMRHDKVDGALVMLDGHILSWSSARDGVLKLWDAQTGVQTGPDMRHDQVNGALAMLDGRILSWSSDGTLKLWDSRTSVQSGPDMRHNGAVWGAIVMPDGRILSWSLDGVLKLWDAATGAQIGPDMYHDGTVRGALVMPDGPILSWWKDGTLKLWDVSWPAGNLFEFVCALLPDTDLAEISTDMGFSIDSPICTDPSRIPLPTWAPTTANRP